MNHEDAAKKNMGDPVWYRQVSPGGYGFPQMIPALFVRKGPRRVAIRVVVRATGQRRTIHVDPKNVSTRDPKTMTTPDPFAGSKGE